MSLRKVYMFLKELPSPGSYKYKLICVDENCPLLGY